MVTGDYQMTEYRIIINEESFTTIYADKLSYDFSTHRIMFYKNTQLVAEFDTTKIVGWYEIQ